MLKTMKIRKLPPLVSEIIDGKVIWQQLENIDYETLGYFLSCHLIIEHYMDEFIKAMTSKLDWESAKLSFGQKIALISGFNIIEPHNFIPAIKHLNSLRNKFSHKIDFKLSTEDLLPFVHFLKKAYKAQHELPTNPIGILEEFTSMTCAWLAGYISSHAGIKVETSQV